MTTGLITLLLFAVLCFDWGFTEKIVNFGFDLSIEDSYFDFGVFFFFFYLVLGLL